MIGHPDTNPSSSSCSDPTVRAPTERGGYVGDVFFGHPEDSTRATHRWDGQRWHSWLPNIGKGSTAPQDDIYALVCVRDALRSCRQTIYHWMKDNGHLDLRPTYAAAQQAYEAFNTLVGLAPEPVFDEEEHIRQRLREGHPDYVGAYSGDPRFTEEADGRLATNGDSGLNPEPSIGEAGPLPKSKTGGA